MFFLTRNIQGAGDDEHDEEEESVERKRRTFFESMETAGYATDLIRAAWASLDNKETKSNGTIEEEG